jgi:hypothetical protein
MAFLASLWAKQEIRWSFTIPIPCMKAYIVVGPTNLNPLVLISLLMVWASFEVAGMFPKLRNAWCMVFPCVKRQRYFAKDPYSL